MTGNRAKPPAVRPTILAALLSLATNAFAGAGLHIEVTPGGWKSYPLGIPAPSVVGGQALTDAGDAVQKVLLADLATSGLFALLDPKSFLADPKKEGFTATTIDFSKWSAVGADGLLKLLVTGDAAKNTLRVEVRLFDVLHGDEDLRKEYAASRESTRAIAHTIADDLLQHFTGERGPFRTHLAYVRTVAMGEKNLVVADYDGHAPQVVAAGGINVLPNWSADAKSLSFTSYRLGAPNLFIVDVASRAVRDLVSRGEFDTGAAFSPDGAKVAFAVGEKGDSNIWVADVDGANAKKLTDSYGIDVSPTWSPDGKRIAFVSARAGTPQLYTMNADGSQQARLTFAGNYNQEPRWSPRGDVIVFTGRDERRVFDLFTINVANGRITRLTQDQGNNNAAAWAPNGRLLVFASNREGGRWALWTMAGHDGGNQRLLLKEAVDVTTPTWSGWPAGLK